MAIHGTRTQRRALLTVHIAASVGWLGVSLAMLTLGLFGRLSADPRSVASAYWAAHVFVDVLVIPLSLLSLVSGTWLALVTTWGLFRRTWVLTKFVLTVITTTLGLVLLRPAVMAAYRDSSPGGDPAKLHDAARSLLVAGCVSTATYLFVTAVSVFKPWGRTRWARARS